MNLRANLISTMQEFYYFILVFIHFDFFVFLLKNYIDCDFWMQKYSKDQRFKDPDFRL